MQLTNCKRDVKGMLKIDREYVGQYTCLRELIKLWFNKIKKRLPKRANMGGGSGSQIFELDSNRMSLILLLGVISMCWSHFQHSQTHMTSFEHSGDPFFQKFTHFLVAASQKFSRISGPKVTFPKNRRSVKLEVSCIRWAWSKGHSGLKTTPWMF